MDKVDWVENLLNIPPADRVKKIYKTRIVSVNKKFQRDYPLRASQFHFYLWGVSLTMGTGTYKILG